MTKEILTLSDGSSYGKKNKYIKLRNFTSIAFKTKKAIRILSKMF